MPKIDEDKLARLVAEWHNQRMRSLSRSEFAVQFSEEAERCWAEARRIKSEIDALVYGRTGPIETEPYPKLADCEDVTHEHS